MRIKLIVFVCFGVLAISMRNVHASTDADMTLWMPLIEECSEENHMDPEAFATAIDEGNNNEIPDCFLACMFRKMGVLDAKGLFDTENAMENAKEYIESEKQVEFSKYVMIHCASVNDKKVSDGDKGCDRAKLLFECIDKRQKEFFN